jgi:hypothetical protein
VILTSAPTSHVPDMALCAAISPIVQKAGHGFGTAKEHDSKHIDDLTVHELGLADTACSDRKRREELRARGVIGGICYKEEQGPEETARLAGEVERHRRPGPGPGRASHRDDEAATGLQAGQIPKKRTQRLRLRHGPRGLQSQEKPDTQSGLNRLARSTTREHPSLGVTPSQLPAMPMFRRSSC